MMWLYWTGAALKEQGNMTGDSDVWDKAQGLWDGPLALFYFAEYSTEVLNEGYTYLEVIEDPM